MPRLRVRRLATFFIALGTVREEEADRPPVARLFFALWPDERVRAELYHLSRLCHGACGGRRTRRESVHLTLAFLGDVELPRLDALQRIGSQVAGEPFTLALDVLGYWKHNRIAWAGATHMPAALSGLVQDLEQRLHQAGFHFERRPYSPHITLLRKALCRDGAPLLERPVRWDVEDFVLVRSARDENGSAYNVIGRWRLQD